MTEHLEPEPTRWLNYRGDRRGMRNVVGPDTIGDYLRPVDAEYNPETNTTRVGFVVTAAPGVAA